MKQKKLLIDATMNTIHEKIHSKDDKPLLDLLKKIPSSTLYDFLPDYEKVNFPEKKISDIENDLITLKKSLMEYITEEFEITREGLTDMVTRVEAIAEDLNFNISEKSTPKKFTILMEQLVPSMDLDSEDLDLYGGDQGKILEYSVPGATKDLALDNFHSNYPISCLDDFQISVKG